MRLVALTILLLLATPGRGEGLPPAPPQDPPVEDVLCATVSYRVGAWYDRLQRGVHKGICTSVAWFDGLFTEERYDEDVWGRLSLSGFWDERDGLDPSLRLRARLPLPALKDRLGVIIGRGNEERLIEDRDQGTGTALPSAFEDVEDESWLLGLGYQPGARLDRGFDFSVGLRLRSGLDPYAKGVYRYSHTFSPRLIGGFQETVFWRDSRGFGETTQLSLDRLIGTRFMLRFANTGTVAEDVDGLDWTSSLTLYQDLPGRRALAYTAAVHGETAAEVSLQDYGFEVRYRRSVLRQWLFLEVSSSVTFPRELRIEERDANLGAGVSLEMYFGPVPDWRLR